MRSWVQFSNPIRAIAFAAIIIFSNSGSSAQTTIKYSSSGTFTWVCPTGVTSVTVQCWGGGGAGGSAKGGIISSAYGGGGAGGAYVSKSVPVTAGNSYTVSVGAAVSTSATNGATVSGNPSWFGSTSTVYAEGGAGGVSKTGGSGNGAGGTASSASSIGTTVFKGGSGASAATGYGGGGGSSAGVLGNGNSGNTAIGGLILFGGAAGGAGTVSGNGTTGTAPGGGGGGGATLLSTSTHTGGGGAAGQVILSYNPCPTSPTISPASATICSGSVQSLSVSATYNQSNSGVTGNSGSSSAASPAPLSTLLSDGQWTQCLITAAQLTAMGYTTGSQINAASLNVQAVNANAVLKNLTISIGTTSLNALTSTFASYLTQVYTTATYTVNAGINTWNFSTPFYWDGSSNIIVEFIFDGNTVSLSGAATYYTTTASNTVTYYSDITGANSITSVRNTGYTLGTTSTQLPDITLSGSNPSTTWSPVASLYTDIGATSSYAGSALSTVYAKPSITTLYTVSATNTACTFTKNATITVNPLTVISTQPASAAYCQGSAATALSVTASGTGVLSYQWYSNTVDANSGGSLVSASSAYTPVTTTPGVLYYYVTVTGSCGSVSSSTAAITTTATPSATIGYSGSPFCGSGVISVNQTGTAGGTYSSAAGLSIDGATGNIDLSTSQGGTYTIDYTIAAGGGCPVYIANTSIVVNAAGTWYGITNDWDDDANWCGGVPTASTNVYIPVVASSIYPATCSSATALANDITIAAGASLTVDGYVIQIGGGISNSGVFDAVNGTVELNSTIAQIIPANTFYNHAIKNIIISNSSAPGVTLNDSLDVYNSLTYGTSGTSFNTNGNLTLKSSASQTAWVGDMTNHLLNGEVRIERYITPHRAWRLLTTPFASSLQTIHDAWQEGVTNSVCTTPLDPYPGYGTEITNTVATPASTGYDAAATYNPSLLYLNAGSWSPVPATNSTYVNSEAGFMLFVRGDRSIVITTPPFATPNSTVLRAKGTLNQGTQTYFTQLGYKLYGNPFASELNLDNIFANYSLVVGSNYVMWDPLLAGTGTNGVGGYVYSSYIGVPGFPAYSLFNTHVSPFTAGRIESGAAFFLYSNPGSFTIEETDKDVSSPLVFRPADAAPAMAQFSTQLISVYDDGSSVLDDGALCLFSDRYSDSVSWLEDAQKIQNPAENLSLFRNGKSIAIEKRASLTVTDTLFYNLSHLKQHRYELLFKAADFINGSLSARLIDNYADTSVSLSLTDTSRYTFEVTGNSASQGIGRFNVIFDGGGVVPIIYTALSAIRQDQDIMLKWSVQHEPVAGNYSIERSLDGRTFTSVSTLKVAGEGNYYWLDTNPSDHDNFYRIRLTDNSGAVLYSKILKVNAVSVISSVAVYPTLISDAMINLAFNNIDKGEYSVRLFNSAGQLVFKTRIVHAGGSATQSVQLPVNLANGNYGLEIGSARQIIYMHQIMIGQ